MQGAGIYALRSLHRESHVKRRIAVLAAVLALSTAVLGGRSVAAQEGTPVPPAVTPTTTTHFANLAVHIWPEYDRPAGLVFMAGDLASDVQLPAQVTITIPAEAGDPTALATQDQAWPVPTASAQQALQWSKATTPAGTAITFTTTSTFVEVDFYLPLNLTVSQRTLNYTLPPEISADNLQLEVQEPAGATGITLDPPIPAVGSDNNGFQYHAQTMTKVAAGTPVKVSMSYTKTDSRTSCEIIGEDKCKPQDQQATGSSSTSSSSGGGLGTPELLLIVLVGVIIAGGTVWYFTQRRPQPAVARAGAAGARPAAPRPRAAVPESPAEEPPPPAGDGTAAGYCTRCGEPSEPEDRFCSHCGTRLRRGAGV